MWITVPDAAANGPHAITVALHLTAANGFSVGLGLIEASVSVVEGLGSEGHSFDAVPNNKRAHVVKKRFISYAKEDAERVKPLVKFLESIKHEYFFDLENIRQNSDWRVALEKELSTCDTFLLCWSRYAVQSDWVVNRELPIFLEIAEQRVGSADLALNQVNAHEFTDPPDPPVAPPKLLRSNQFREYTNYKTDERVRRTKPGYFYNDGINYPKMITIPTGEFKRGSKSTERGHKSDEGPRLEVVIGKRIAVGEVPVTVEEWNFAAMNELSTASKTIDKLTSSRHPVTGVSWDDAVAYTKWLAETTRFPYRLLSEAEWEYVCRAGNRTPFTFERRSETISMAQANYAGAIPYSGGKPDFLQKNFVKVVDSFQLNPWKIRGMHGNVWEWVEDCYFSNYNVQPRDGSAWVTDEDDALRVMRGGSFKSGANYLRSAARGSHTRDFTSDAVGFRVACDLR